MCWCPVSKRKGMRGITGDSVPTNSVLHTGSFVMVPRGRRVRRVAVERGRSSQVVTTYAQWRIDESNSDESWASMLAIAEELCG